MYDTLFDVVPVETAEQLMAAFRLRYQVYCVENQYEDPEKNPRGLEIDAYDQQSLHSLLVYRPTGEVAGTVRLILPTSGKQGFGLPLRDVCHHELLVRENVILPWARTAEISRFAISKKVSQRTMNPEGREQAFLPDSHRRGNSLGLMQAVIAMAASSGITHLCAAMEPALLRMLRHLGLDFPSLGPEVEYHGRRQPCYAELDTGLANTWLKRRDVWRFLTRDGSVWPLNGDAAAGYRNRDLPVRNQRWPAMGQLVSYDRRNEGSNAATL